MRRLRHPVLALLTVACLIAAGVALAAPSFRAVITGQTLDYGKRTARFSFRAAGGAASRFRCALRLGGSQSKFADCRSPVTYRHLQQATYTFTVFAARSSGVLSMPATRTFTIRPNLNGSYTGGTSQTKPNFSSGVKIVVRNGLVQASSSISWAAHCTGQVGSFTDLTHFSGPVQKGHFSDRRRVLQHLQGDTEDSSTSIHFTINGSRASGTFTDTSTVLQGSAVIAHCSTGTVRFTARHA